MPLIGSNRVVIGTTKGVIIHGDDKKTTDARRPMFAQTGRNWAAGQGRMRSWSSDDQSNTVVHRYGDERKN